MIEKGEPKSKWISYYPKMFTCPLCKKSEELTPFVLSQQGDDPVFEVITYASHVSNRHGDEYEMCYECHQKVIAYIESLKPGARAFKGVVLTDAPWPLNCRVCMGPIKTAGDECDRHGAARYDAFMSSCDPRLCIGCCEAQHETRSKLMLERFEAERTGS